MAFTDDFTNAGAQQNLSSRSGWTLADGTASEVFVPAAGSTLHCVPIVGDTSVRCTDQGSANHYTEVVWSAASAAGFICIRHTDSNNFIGFRNNGTVWQVFKRVAGTFTQLGIDYAASPVSGDVVRITGDGNTFTLLLNSVQRCLGTGVTETFNNTETRQGVCARSSDSTPWITDWVASSLAAASATGAAATYYNSLIGRA